VLFELGWETLTNWRAVVIAFISIGVTFGFKKVLAVWTVIGGAVLGYILNLI
jgi:chromate transporter